ncbi:hypothetical protein [Edaphosphingomonas haloaromaticamans]|uniref:Gram-negative bacterial tonB protein n=1 Tax=Edaphosphingomonas haloaromaticamans TaxID=653954 RepID=A0A1S1HDD3_9SPHN|nr:hypothetical protein [Sphingomonas haloaromaticamans]OHT18480.1 hypothetical protein BHE75_00451 [Sphingomonas haloaromaticamans]
MRQAWRASIPLALGLPFVSAGCTAPRMAGAVVAPVPAPERAAAMRAIQVAADQVKRCYRSPRSAGAARTIATTLTVRYAPDGTLIGLPQVARQSGVTPEISAQAERMAEAAALAVLRCQPIRLPADLYENGWSEFQLTFSPGGAA